MNYSFHEVAGKEFFAAIDYYESYQPYLDFAFQKTYMQQ
jgi:hypothetical protein